MTLLEYKESEGHTFRSLEAKLGIDKSLLNDYCKGKKEPTLRTALIIQFGTENKVLPTVADWNIGEFNEKAKKRKDDEYYLPRRRKRAQDSNK